MKTKSKTTQPTPHRDALGLAFRIARIVGTGLMVLAWTQIACGSNNPPLSRGNESLFVAGAFGNANLRRLATPGPTVAPTAASASNPATLSSSPSPTLVLAVPVTLSPSTSPTPWAKGADVTPVPTLEAKTPTSAMPVKPTMPPSTAQATSIKPPPLPTGTKPLTPVQGTIPPTKVIPTATLPGAILLASPTPRGVTAVPVPLTLVAPSPTAVSVPTNTPTKIATPIPTPVILSYP